MIGTVVVLTVSEGAYEDCTPVESIYYVRIKDFNMNEEYDNYISDLYKEIGIEGLLDDNVEKFYESKKKVGLKKIKQLLKEERSTREYFLEKVIGAMKMHFTIHNKYID